MSRHMLIITAVVMTVSQAFVTAQEPEISERRAELPLLDTPMIRELIPDTTPALQQEMPLLTPRDHQTLTDFAVRQFGSGLGFSQGLLTAKVLYEFEPNHMLEQAPMCVRILREGYPIAGSGCWFLFDATEERCIFAAISDLTPEMLLPAEPLPALVAREELETTARTLGGARFAELGEIMWSTEFRRYVVACRLAQSFDTAALARGELPPDATPWTIENILLDAHTAQPLRRQLTTTSGGDVSGRLIGRYIPASGPDIRRLQCDTLPPIQGIPNAVVVLTDTSNGLFTYTSTAEDGAFCFENVSPDSAWELSVSFSSNRTRARVTLFTPRDEQLPRIQGQGPAANQEIDLSPNPDLEPYESERIAGDITAWVALLRIQEVIYNHALEPLGLLPRPAPDVWLPGTPRLYPLQVVHLAQVGPDWPNATGQYQDFPDWPARIGVSEANRRVRDYAGWMVLAHEFGHFLTTLILNGIRNRGGYPEGPEWTVAEGFSDYTAWLAMAVLDPERIADGRIQWCRDRGAPESYQRDIRHGCELENPIEPNQRVAPDCRMAIHPTPRDEIHAASLPISGALYDLTMNLVEQHGLEEGRLRGSSFCYGYCNFFQGGPIPGWTLLTPGLLRTLLLAINESPRFGGDNFLGTPSPDHDLITRVLAARGWHYPEFVRGDVNDDGEINLSDAVRILEFLFLGAEELRCLDAADTDDSAQVNLSDPVFMLGTLFLGGPPLVAPTTCGPDPTFLDRLTCVEPAGECL